MTKNVLLDVETLSVKCQGKALVSNVNLRVHEKEIVTIIGPNGAGKSTLVKAILGLVPCTGKIKRGKGLRVGYMPQRLTLSPLIPMTVSRFLALTPGSTKKGIRAILAELSIERLGDTNMLDLSGGEFQRVLLARALLNEPQLLILDEPIQGVDVSGQAEFFDLLRHIRDEYHCGVLMISHDLHFVMQGTDFVLCLNKHVCCQGCPEKVAQEPAFEALFYTHQHNHTHDLKGKVIPS